MGTPKGTRPWNADTSKGWTGEIKMVRQINAELYEALELVCNIDPNHDSLSDTQNRWRMARAALAKARGEV